MSDYKKYLKGDYQGTKFEKTAQKFIDTTRAIHTEKQINIKSQNALQTHTEEMLKQNDITSDKIANLLEDYNTEDKFHEYLINGAILTCTSCTLDGFELPASGIYPKEYICLETENDSADEMYQRLQTVLNVEENSTEINKIPYATVNDTIKGINIIPFRCNCSVGIIRNTENEKVAMNMEFCRKYGVCACLMDLNEQWDNMPLENGKSYLIKTDVNKDGVSVEAEGITRTSILFCKHGGLIVPITSGQDNVELEIEDILSVTPTDNYAVMKYMWDFFRNAGFSEIAVAGILGNVWVESDGFKPDVISPSGYYGLFQYGGARKKDFINKSGGNEGWKDVQFQCEYALWEYNNSSDSWVNQKVNKSDGTILNSTKSNFENATNAADAALAWGASYERAVDSNKKLDNHYYSEIQHQQDRIDYANKIYQHFVFGEEIDN